MDLAIGLSYGALGWQFWSILTIIEGRYDRPPRSANAGGPLGTPGSFPQLKTGGSDSRASRILEEVGIVAEMRDSAVQQLHSGSTFGRRCSSFRKSGQW